MESNASLHPGRLSVRGRRTPMVLVGTFLALAIAVWLSWTVQPAQAQDVGFALSGRQNSSIYEDGSDFNNTYPLPFSVSGAEGVVSWTLSGDDGHLFHLTGSGDKLKKLEFISLPNAENPLDADASNLYELTIQATDGVGSATLVVWVYVLDVPLDADEVPVILGKAQVGKTLKVDPTRISRWALASAPSYQWIRNDGSADTEISGATSDSYMLTSDDLGKTVKVRMDMVLDDKLFDDDGRRFDHVGKRPSRTSAATATVVAATAESSVNSPATGAPAVGGTPAIYTELTADVSGIADADGLTNVYYRYQWFVNHGTGDVDIIYELRNGDRLRGWADQNGARDHFYLGAHSLDATIGLRVTFLDDAGNWETLTSRPTAPVGRLPNSPATGKPTIEGTPSVGETLRADVSSIQDANGFKPPFIQSPRFDPSYLKKGFTYQWIRNDGAADTEIASTIFPTYKLTAADVGHTIKVSVSFIDAAYYEEVLTSAATPVVVKKYAALIAQMYEWRNDPQWVSEKEHTDRWDRALLSFGETVADQTLTPMKAAEAQGYADQDWERWVEVAKALGELEAASLPPVQPNRAPTVRSAISDETLVNGSAMFLSLSGRFDDADGDSLTFTAASSDETKATAEIDVSTFRGRESSTLGVTTKAPGTATITVTADDGNGGTVEDAFTVTVVKAAPLVASAISDVTGLEVDGTREVSLAGVFYDADGDTLTITASSSDETKATVTVASDGSKLDLAGVGVGTATITVTARDTDGNTVSDSFDAPVAKKYAALIAQMYEWRNDPRYVNDEAHTDRWDQALLALGETVADQTLTKMTAAEAQGYVDQGWERWEDVAQALKEIEGAGQQQGTPNQAPTVSSAIADATIVNESGTHPVSLSGVFDDGDNDALTVTAASSGEAIATVSVSSDGSSLTVSAQARGTATITVTANDGNGGTVDDTFTVTVKAAPVVASALADVSGLEMETTREVSLAGVFSDADGDSLTITASSSDETKATVSVASDGSSLTLAGVAEGTTTFTVTAEDSDGNTVSDAFEVEVVKRFASLIPQMYQWRNDPQWKDYKEHTDRWDQALLAFGETVADTTLTPMTADEAQGYADKGWERWVEVAKALRELEGG